MNIVSSSNNDRYLIIKYSCLNRDLLTYTKCYLKVTVLASVPRERLEMFWWSATALAKRTSLLLFNLYINKHIAEAMVEAAMWKFSPRDLCTDFIKGTHRSLKFGFRYRWSLWRSFLIGEFSASPFTNGTNALAGSLASSHSWFFSLLTNSLIISSDSGITRRQRWITSYCRRVFKRNARKTQISRETESKLSLLVRHTDSYWNLYSVGILQTNFV